MSAAVIEINNIAKTFTSGYFKKSAFQAVADLSFAVEPGEIFAFLGPNGAGKSTTINMIMGFLQPSRGKIAVFGAAPGERSARARIGYLPENYAFYTFLTAPKLLNFFGRLFQIPERERKQRIEELLHKLGLWEARNLTIGKFSRGMRQRVGIAQALLNNPELLVLDEPTSGFDPVGRRMVRDLLMEVKKRGTSIFLCSHILSEVEDICDRVVIIKRGKVIQQGALSEIVGAHSGYEITFTDPTGAIAAQLKTLGLAANPAEELMQTATDDEALAQRAVDVIRAYDGTLKAFTPRTRTLEDVFLNTVGPSA